MDVLPSELTRFFGINAKTRGNGAHTGGSRLSLLRT